MTHYHFESIAKALIMSCSRKPKSKLAKAAQLQHVIGELRAIHQQGKSEGAEDARPVTVRDLQNALDEREFSR